MKRMIRYFTLSLALTFCASVAAHAHSNHVAEISHFEVAPEVDPGMAITALTLLAGAVTVGRTRRRSS